LPFCVNDARQRTSVLPPDVVEVAERLKEEGRCAWAEAKVEWEDREACEGAGI